MPEYLGFGLWHFSSHKCLVSLNVSELSKIDKRNNILVRYLNISCYNTGENAEIIFNIWKGKSYFQSGTSQSKGLIILINENFEISNIKWIKKNERCSGVSFEYLTK